MSNDRLYFWHEYNMPAVFDYAGQEMLFKDKRFGREKLKNQSKDNEKHLTDFNHIEKIQCWNLNLKTHQVKRSGLASIHNAKNK